MTPILVGLLMLLPIAVMAAIISATLFKASR